MKSIHTNIITTLFNEITQTIKKVHGRCSLLLYIILLDMFSILLYFPFAVPIVAGQFQSIAAVLAAVLIFSKVRRNKLSFLTIIYLTLHVIILFTVLLICSIAFLFGIYVALYCIITGEKIC